MTKNDLLSMLKKRILILDGATGTELQKMGMPTGVCPEKWVLENPDILKKVQKDYIDNGSNIVYSYTFGSNRLKLEEFGLQDNLKQVNKDLVKISKEAAEGRALVAGDMAPTGRFVEPFGDLPFEECVAIYKEQAEALYEAGVDLFVVETMIDIQEMRAAVIAIKETCDLPIMASMTFSEDGYTLTGTDPLTALITLQSLGVTVFGCNCSTGPEAMLKIIKDLKPYAHVPLFAKPNAGLPKLRDGKTVFEMGADEYGSFAPMFAEAGVNMIGGCCGTTPLYINQYKKRLSDVKPIWVKRDSLSSLSGPRRSSVLNFGEPVRVIGERINPTGKKKLQEALRAGQMDEVKKLAQEQAKAGADFLDVNMGMPGIDEEAMMIYTVNMLSSSSELPLVIDSSNALIIEKALRIYPGRALINSISLEEKKIPLLEIAAKYGAMFVLLPLTDESIPADCDGRIANTERLIAIAESKGLHKEDIVVDGITMTVSSDEKSGLETINFIRWCRNNSLHTTLGLSNISFGLPERKWINGAFLSMCIFNGLTMAIANPNEEVLMNIKYASDVLVTNDKNARNYISNIVKTETGEKINIQVNKSEKTILNSVVDGDKDSIVGLIEKAIKDGVTPQDIIDKELIPGINKVGDLYDKKIYFLPQLISGAETMKKAFGYLEQFIVKTDVKKDNNKKIILATVKGDIHDIGKNIVGIMLKNYGYDVIDLGKDVSEDVIIDRAIKEGASIIGLSALMTTTMVNMKDVVKLARQKMKNAKIFIGGAVITDEYSKEIGADGFAKDGLDAVRVADRLLASLK